MYNNTDTVTVSVTEPAARDPERERQHRIWEALKTRIEPAAAQQCPPEHRAAYIHILESSHHEAIDGTHDLVAENEQEAEKWREAHYFQSTITQALIATPELDPALMADIVDAVADHLPDCDRFAERLRTLALLRMTPAEIEALH